MSLIFSTPASLVINALGSCAVSADGRHICYVGYGSTDSCYSTNGGLTFTTASAALPQPANFAYGNALSFSANGSKLYYTSGSNNGGVPYALAFVSTDGGASFSATSDTFLPVGPNYAGSISCSRDGTKVCISNSTQISYSSDSGFTWTYLDSNLDVRCSKFFDTDSKLYVVGGNNIYTFNAAETLTLIATKELLRGGFNSIACSPNGQKIIIVTQGAEGYMYSETGPTGLVIINSTSSPAFPFTDSLNCVSASDDLSKILFNTNPAGETPNIIYTTDSGTTYETATFATYSYSSSSSSGLFAICSNNRPNGLIGAPAPPPPICFKEDSAILCSVNGVEVYVPIQNIRNGDLVKTLKSGFVPVNMIGTSKLYNPGNKLRGNGRLYKCSKEKFPELSEDLIITGCHSILVDSLTEEQKDKIIELSERIFVTDGKYRLMACVDERAEPYEEEGTFNIWHLALDHDDERMNYGIFANGGLLVETTSKRMLSKYSGMELIV